MNRRVLAFALLTPLSLGAQGVASGGARPVSLEEAVKLAQRQEMSGKHIVVLLPDGAERYLSTALFDMNI